ncbi:fermentation associated protein [Rhizoctonia solani]|uniref:Fermentation associated protein n=1 Tax=Rhizoctonia solani TaxID=456999 RepID=A0A8H7IHP4_9AGAM|nr:fermentation associated protein [Rhizoctonia solani]
MLNYLAEYTHFLKGLNDVLAPPDVEGTTEETPHPVLATTYPPTPSSSSQKSVVDENQGIWNKLRTAVWRFRKGALVVGNDSTPSILIMDIAGGTGSYGVSQSRSKYDEYKQMYDIQLGQVKLITRTNPDYRKRMVDRGMKSSNTLVIRESNNLPPGSLSFETFRQIIHRLSLPFSAPATPYLSGAAPFPKKWGGLARYHHTNNDSSEKTGILHEPEYAKVTCLLETPALNIIYYGDVAGKVPHHAKTMPTEPVDIGNGDEAPEWGIEVELHGGPSTITYGPWADRQRVHWQQMLAPSTYQNTQPTPKLKTGDLRQSVSLRVSIRFRDEVKFRIPTREPSKASSLLGDLDIQRRRHRRYGWLDLRIEAESFIKYTLPMVASCDGYTAILEANLKTVAASSSVNQVEFLRADRCTIRATMPTPHKWNAERKWDVQVGLVKPSIKLLRDHINLVSDIVKDWTSIPLPPNSMEDVKRLATEEYNRFVPITYSLGVALESYRLDLYANDHNIVDWPLSHVDNSFLTLTGHNLSTNVLILSNEFRPEFSATPFEVIAPNLDLTLSMPKWNTHSAFSTPRTSNIGHVKSLSVSGSYTSYADIRADAVDRLRMDIEVGKNILFKAFGWAIRHLMVVKENYFGMFTNFTMRNEFFTKLHSQNLGDPVREKYREGQTNPFEIDMGLVVSDSLLVLPQEVFDCQGATLVRLPELQVILRSHEHAMGEISGRLSVSSLVGILASARAFRINFADDFNSPSSDFAPPPLPDITFLRVTCPLIDVTIGLGTTIDHILPRPQEAYEDSLLHFSISKGFSIRLTDRPHPSYASCMRFDLPNISFRILQRVTGFHQTWFELASISADISGEQASAPLGWKEHTQEQLNFLRMQDATTHRVGFLYGSNLPVSEVPRHGGLTYLTPLKVPFGFGEHKIRPNSTAESGFEGKEYADSFRSEQDEVMTEASRDARSLTPQVVIGKSGLMFKGRNPTLDGEISSGDESDNDPSEYEPSMTSSVVAFGEDEISVQSPQWPFVDHYRQALRRYRPVYSGYNAEYETFCLKHATARKDAQDNEDTSSLKITVQHGLNVMVTQLVYRSHSSTLDLLVDSILDDFLDIPVSNHNGTANRLSVEIDIPLTRIMFLQSLMSSTEADALSTGVRRHTALPIHVDARVLALFDIEVQQAACRLETLSSIDHQTTICVKASSIDSRLRKLVSKPFAHSGYELEPSTDKLRLKFSGAGLDLSLSDKSPEILITALEASNHSIGRVTSFMESASELSSRRRPDPFATNLPSFLVQTGRPGRLRSDPSWKILTILHQCMLTNKELTELSPLTQKRWAELYGQDEQGSHKVPAILQKLFPSKSENHSPLLFRGTLALSSRHTKFVLQSREGDYNEMKLSDFNLHLRCSTANYLPQHLPESIVADTEKSLHVIGAISARELDMSIYPSCVLFIRQVLFVQRQMTALGIDHEKPVQSNKPFTIPFRHVVLELALSASSLAFAAPAQQITFEAQTSGCTTSISSVITLPEAPSPPRGSLSVSFTADAILLQANQWKTNKASKSLLAGIELRHVVIHGAANEDTGSSTHARVLLSLDQFKINVPRSVLQLYRFIDSWRTEYLPAYDSMIQDLLLELDYNPRPRNPSPYSPALFSGDLKINVHAQMRELRTELHVMHGTWLTWSVLHSVTFLDLKGTQETEFGHRIGSQVIQLINGQPNIGRPTPNTNSVSLELPSLRLEGKYPQLDIRMHVDRFSVTLKPQYFDDFLAVQQKFGSDFNELVDLAIEFKTQRGTPLTEPSETIPTMFAKFDVSFTFDGFRIGIEGPSSTQYLDSSTIKGQVHSGTQKRWSFGVESLALSLAHQSAPRRARTNFDRKYRSAYMVFDMSAHNIEHLDSSQENHLGITINFVHAVMQPAAIAELGDLIDHIQAEMLSRQEQRAAELEEIRRKTRQVMRTLEHNDHPHSIRETKTFLDNRKIEFTVKDIGIVFPLTLQDDLMLPQMGSSIISPFSPSSVPALLISLSSVSFVTQRYETGQAKIQEFSFQFVPGFDQSQPGHFNGSTHDTRNRMIYPSMEAEVRSTSTPTTRQVRIRAIVSGFELDIEPSIVNYVFSIVDVYRQGRDRISRLATYTTRSDAASSITQLAPAVPSNAQYSAVLTTNIKASFEFKSGRIRTHTPSVRASDPERTQSVPTLSPQTEIFEHGTDILDLPMVSAWLEYKATPACQKVMGSTTPNQSILVCDTTIHPISNVLKPSLLPFLTDVSKRVQERLAHAPTPPRSPGATPFSDLSTIHEGVSLDDSPGGASVTGSMQVIFSLNINKSTLELTCQPDVNVVAGLNWESGGFVVTISPGAREVAVVGTMTSLTAGIQHGYLNEDSISAKAQNLTFSVDFRKLKSDEDATTNSVSAVWLDRIPVFDSLVRPPPVHSSVSVIKAELPGSNYVPLTQPFQTLVLVNVDKVNIMADLGPTIAQVTLDIESLTFRTRLCEDVSEATSPWPNWISYPNVRHGKLSHDIDGHAKMLELTLKSGDIEAAMEYERQHLMHFHADPLHVTIFDDWSKVDSNIPVQDREMISLGGKLAALIKAQKLGAARESNAFRTSQMPKPDTALSEVAAAMLQSARSKFRETETFQFAVIQRLKLSIKTLKLAVPPVTQQRAETALFTARQVEGELHRTIRPHEPPRRKLLLELGAFSIRGYRNRADKTCK